MNTNMNKIVYNRELKEFYKEAVSKRFNTGRQDYLNGIEDTLAIF